MTSLKVYLFVFSSKGPDQTAYMLSKSRLSLLPNTLKTVFYHDAACIVMISMLGETLADMVLKYVFLFSPKTEFIS